MGHCPLTNMPPASLCTTLHIAASLCASAAPLRRAHPPRTSRTSALCIHLHLRRARPPCMATTPAEGPQIRVNPLHVRLARPAHTAAHVSERGCVFLPFFSALPHVLPYFPSPVFPTSFFLLSFFFAFSSLSSSIDIPPRIICARHLVRRVPRMHTPAHCDAVLICDLYRFLPAPLAPCLYRRCAHSPRICSNPHYGAYGTISEEPRALTVPAPSPTWTPSPTFPHPGPTCDPCNPNLALSSQHQQTAMKSFFSLCLLTHGASPH
ncbi:hypothetical protein C8F04DRAFT_223807 [Mycena alexandri]|uniref:Uncharacterized protein n=1 Tax=Mycena alexandri TaxID=1745969 RepID=A0AAD6SPE2_9AGAR|nr:hypothetical protein C8F04DRAFT_709970 [Mycena alexandri]KAJ7040642.1 hypothetical protein C8F04DRAFT_223807 [Mycena alexandri]